MDPDQKIQEAGFTTVEIIAVLLLLAAITAVIVSRYSTGTVDAAALCKMADRGQITGGVLDGPLALDNAIDLGAARIKKITSVAPKARSSSPQPA